MRACPRPAANTIKAADANPVTAVTSYASSGVQDAHPRTSELGILTDAMHPRGPDPTGDHIVTDSPAKIVSLIS
jgi:hypothetical protein